MYVIYIEIIFAEQRLINKSKHLCVCSQIYACSRIFYSILKKLRFTLVLSVFKILNSLCTCGR